MNKYEQGVNRVKLVESEANRQAKVFRSSRRRGDPGRIGALERPSRERENSTAPTSGNCPTSSATWCDVREYSSQYVREWALNLTNPYTTISMALSVLSLGTLAREEEEEEGERALPG